MQLENRVFIETDLNKQLRILSCESAAKEVVTAKLLSNLVMELVKTVRTAMVLLGNKDRMGALGWLDIACELQVEPKLASLVVLEGHAHQIFIQNRLSVVSSQQAYQCVATDIDLWVRADVVSEVVDLGSWQASVVLDVARNQCFAECFDFRQLGLQAVVKCVLYQTCLEH